MWSTIRNSMELLTELKLTGCPKIDLNVDKNEYSIKMAPKSVGEMMLGQLINYWEQN